MTENIKLAVFDCDGTLVDSQHSIVAAMFEAFDVHDLARPGAEAVRRIVGLPLTKAIAVLSPYLAAETHESLTYAYKEAFGRMRAQGEVPAPLYPGALEALAELEDDGWLLGVATGKSRRGLNNTLARHGIAERFVTLQTSDHGPGKPHPDMLLRAMAETGVEGANLVMIGDTTYDMEMARSAGVMAIGVSWGYHGGDELLATGAGILVNGFGDLAQAVGILMEAAS